MNVTSPGACPFNFYCDSDYPCEGYCHLMGKLGSMEYVCPVERYVLREKPVDTPCTCRVSADLKRFWDTHKKIDTPRDDCPLRTDDSYVYGKDRVVLDWKDPEYFEEPR